MDQQFSGEGPTDNEVSAEECLTDNEEMKKAENISSIYSIEVKEYSTFNKLIRTTAWANSFINNLKSKIKNKYIHKKTISRRSGMGRSNKDIGKLNIKWDENWILLCYRRLTPARKEANITPIYLPKKNHVARLLIKDHHQRLFHAGASHCHMWCFARFGYLLYNLKNAKNTHGGVLLLVRLQAFTWVPNLVLRSIREFY